MGPAIGSQPTSRELDRLAASIRQRPLRALTLFAAAGFLVGGGLCSGPGLALGLSIGRSFANRALVSAIESLVENKMEDNIDQIKGELEEARQSLHQTMTEVNQKVETVSTQLQPGHLVGRHPLLSATIAAALGFTSGNRSSGPIAVLLLGGLLGAGLSEAWNDGFRNRDTA